MKMDSRVLILAVVLLATVPAGAEEPTENAAPQPPCSRPEAAQFDFWLGEWDVEAGGKVVGHNLIAKIHGGCTILEDYFATGGSFEGKSFNYFDPADESWHQVWVDNGGTRLHLNGGFADGKMVLSGRRAAKDGTVLDRISWTDNPDGTVRQHWELSRDDGATWKTLFDGLYRHPGSGAEGEGD